MDKVALHMINAASYHRIVRLAHTAGELMLRDAGAVYHKRLG
jgi:hypothetical protein